MQLTQELNEFNLSFFCSLGCTDFEPMWFYANYNFDKVRQKKTLVQKVCEQPNRLKERERKKEINRDKKVLM